jgi:hypothetical protein
MNFSSLPIGSVFLFNQTFECVKISKNEIMFRRTDYEDSDCDYTHSLWPKAADIDDWFEEEYGAEMFYTENPSIALNKKKCACDFYSVVLRTGCVCGGK